MISNQDFSVYKGTDVVIEVPINYDNNEPVDLSNATFKCVMKRNYSDYKPENLIDLTPVISPGNNTLIHLSLTKDQTLRLKADKYFYNLDITFDDSVTIPVMEGYIEVLENTNANL